MPHKTSKKQKTNMKLLPLKISTGRCDAIDRIKLFAIISVIILHAVPKKWLYYILSPYHIWQAVPLFMILAGVTGSHFYQKHGINSLRDSLRPTVIIHNISRIMIPFFIVLVFQIFCNIVLSPSSPREWIYSGIRSGGYGPGSYFVWIFLQHLLIFPFILTLDKKTRHYKFLLRILMWLTISVAIDYACILISMPSGLYRLFYGRYLMAVVIGIWLLQTPPRRFISSILILIGISYLTATAYFGWVPKFKYPTWIQSHAFAYSYSAVLFLAIWYSPSFIQKISNPLLILGKASYHIYLIQMVYFWIFHIHINHLFGTWVLCLPVAIFFCCGVGVIFYVSEQKIRKYWQD